MADITSHSSQCKRFVRRGWEFHVYFALIFLIALPFSTVGWVLDVLGLRTLNLHGPLARAWAEADRITPLIFSA